MPTKPTNIATFRTSNICASIMTVAAQRGLHLVPWAVDVPLDAEVPRPGHRDGHELDATTGLGLGWCYRAAGCFADASGTVRAVMYAQWNFDELNPAPGERGFHEWHRHLDSHVLVGVHYLPRVEPISST